MKKETTEAGMMLRVDAFKRDLQKIRTGRANVAMLDDIKIDFYGEATPLNQIATVHVDDARLITVKPWEKNMIPVIANAIRASALGINPISNSECVRLPIPPLTQEGRKGLAKIVAKVAEEARVAVRHVRRETLDTIKKTEKLKQLTEDQCKTFAKETQDLTDKYIAMIDSLATAKEKEILDF